MSISSLELTGNDISALLNSIHYYEVTHNEEDLRGVTECVWEKLRSLQFTRLEKKTVKELCRQYIDKKEIDHIQGGLEKIIQFTDPNENRVIRKLQYISSKLGAKQNNFLHHLVPSSYWTRSVIEEAYRAFSSEASSRELLQIEYPNIFQSVQRIVENFDKMEPLRVPLFFALLCMQEASGLNLPIQTVERCFLAFLDEKIYLRQINLSSVDSFEAFHFCREFMISFPSHSINPIYQRYMESKQKKRPVDDSWKSEYRQEKITQSSSAPSKTTLDSKAHFNDFVRRRSIGRDPEDREVREEQLEPLPQGDIHFPVKKVKTSPKIERATISSRIKNGEKYLQKIKEWRLESDTEELQRLMNQLGQEEAALSPKERRFYLYAKKRILDIQTADQVDIAQACDRFIEDYEKTLKKMYLPAALYNQIPLHISYFPKFQQFIFAALRKDEEWLQNEYAERLSATPQTSSLGPEELMALEDTIDLLAASSEKHLVAKHDWYAQIFAELDFVLLTQILSFQGASKGDVYEIIKPKIVTSTIMKKLREAETELLSERATISKREFNHKMRQIQERERGVRDIIFSLVMSQEYFRNFTELQSFFSGCLCSYLVLLNGNASIYFPDRLKALLREYHQMRPFFE